MKKQCKLIGLDTSTTESGYSIFEDGKLFSLGTLSSDKKEKTERYHQMLMNIYVLLNREKPDIVVIELTVVCKNADTQRKLTKILGAVELWCLVHNCFYYEYRPTEWRKLVRKEEEKLPRKREELKAWSIATAQTYCKDIVNDNVADAFLIGLAYLFQFGRQKERAEQ